MEEPQTNGVAERCNRTLKDQAIHGQVFNNIKEVRQAVRAVVEVHNEHWRVEKLGVRSPAQMRRECFQEAA
ncbi:MAG TPA: integrase core domain-containing protein [Thermoanaerobaculaceae bacterium]|nr:integrase core domain-containing protein [Thermoanaerobaculaceae bacterium]HRS16042.1 integrase core domain-containing protein [Thermoanaerobaculaceae bacterium]